MIPVFGRSQNLVELQMRQEPVWFLPHSISTHIATAFFVGCLSRSEHNAPRLLALHRIVQQRSLTDGCEVPRFLKSLRITFFDEFQRFLQLQHGRKLMLARLAAEAVVCCQRVRRFPGEMLTESFIVGSVRLKRGNASRIAVCRLRQPIAEAGTDGRRHHLLRHRILPYSIPNCLAPSGIQDQCAKRPSGEWTVAAQRLQHRFSRRSLLSCFLQTERQHKLIVSAPFRALVAGRARTPRPFRADTCFPKSSSPRVR